MSKNIAYQGFFTMEVHETAQGKREVVFTTDSVCVLVFDKPRDRIILVRQPRQSMVNDDNPQGLITESVAGRFDTKIGVEALVVKELREEIGATIRGDQVRLLNYGHPMAVSAGAITEKCYLSFVELEKGQLEETEREFTADKEDERISRVYLHISEIGKYICEDVRVFTLLQYFQLLYIAKLAMSMSPDKERK